MSFTEHLLCARNFTQYFLIFISPLSHSSSFPSTSVLLLNCFCSSFFTLYSPFSFLPLTLSRFVLPLLLVSWSLILWIPTLIFPSPLHSLPFRDLPQYSRNPPYQYHDFSSKKTAVSSQSEAWKYNGYQSKVRFCKPIDLTQKFYRVKELRVPLFWSTDLWYHTNTSPFLLELSMNWKILCHLFPSLIPQKNQDLPEVACWASVQIVPHQYVDQSSGLRKIMSKHNIQTPSGRSFFSSLSKCQISSLFFMHY